jgi:hypothetical protein
MAKTCVVAEENGEREYAFEGAIPSAQMDVLANGSLIDSLWWGRGPRVTLQVARRLAASRVRDLTLWTTVNRYALRQIVRMPDLQALTLLRLSGPGRLKDFRLAESLRSFSCSYLASEDLLEVATCASLEELRIQNARLDRTSLAAILALPHLRLLDLESSYLDDAMVRRISRSTTITSLEIGSTRLTREGLRHLVCMQQLEALDIWANHLNLEDLRLLPALRRLEYLSLGEYDGIHSLDPAGVVEVLLAMPGLKHVWLDGVRLDAVQKALLEGRFERFRHTDAD